MKPSTSINLSLIALIISISTLAHTITVNELRETKIELLETRDSLRYRDSMWYAEHEIREQLAELLSGNPDSGYIMRQIIAESGNMESPQFRRNKNLFGFHNGRDYLRFNHWKESYQKFMRDFYCDRRPGESYCAFLRRKKFGSLGVVDYCTEK